MSKLTEKLWRAFESEEIDRKNSAIKQAIDEIELLRSALNSIFDECNSDYNETLDELSYICQDTARHALRVNE